MPVSRVGVGDTSKKGISVFDIQILPEDRGQKFGQMEEEASEQMRPLLTTVSNKSWSRFLFCSPFLKFLEITC